MCAAQVEGRDAGRYIGWRSWLPFCSDQLVRELRDSLPPFRAVASPGEIANEPGALMLTHRCSCFSSMSGGPVRLLRHPHAFVGIHAGSNRMPCLLLRPQISRCYGCCRAASCLMRVTFACIDNSSHCIHEDSENAEATIIMQAHCRLYAKSCAFSPLSTSDLCAFCC